MSFSNIIAALPATLFRTSPTVIGLTTCFLSSGISLQATNDSSSSTHNFLISSANILRKSTVAVPKAR